MMFLTTRNKSKRLLLMPLCVGGGKVTSITSDSVTLWTAVRQAPLSMEFSRQEYWSGLPCPSPGDLPNPGIKSTWAGGFFTTSATWEDWVTLTSLFSRLFFFYFGFLLPYLGIHDPPSILLLWVFMYVKWVYYRHN